MGQYLPVVVMLVLAVVFGALSRVASQLLAPRMSTAAKSSPYESGIVPSREPAQRFPVKFALDGHDRSSCSTSRSSSCSPGRHRVSTRWARSASWRC
jgi:hypothetical protein